MSATIRNPAIYAVIGIITAFFYAVIWIVAAENDPSWALGESKISDLSASGLDSADIFKYGTIIAGILFVIFGAGKILSEKDCNLASGISTILAGLFIVMLFSGVLDLNGDAKDLLAYLVLGTIVISMSLSTKGNWDASKRVFGAIDIVLVTLIVGMAVGKSFEYVEATALICMLLWMMSEGAKMILLDAPAVESGCATE